MFKWMRLPHPDHECNVAAQACCGACVSSSKQQTYIRQVANIGARRSFLSGQRSFLSGQWEAYCKDCARPFPAIKGNRCSYKVQVPFYDVQAQTRALDIGDVVAPVKFLE